MLLMHMVTLYGFFNFSMEKDHISWIGPYQFDSHIFYLCLSVKLPNDLNYGGWPFGGWEYKDLGSREAGWTVWIVPKRAATRSPLIELVNFHHLEWAKKLAALQWPQPSQSLIYGEDWSRWTLLRTYPETIKLCEGWCHWSMADLFGQ